MPIMYPCGGVGYGTVQNSGELTGKLFRQRAMSESGVPKESLKPCSNDPVPLPDNSTSAGAGKVLDVLSARGKRWEDLSKKEPSETSAHNEVCVC